jgi:predicted RNase H-like nuclease
MIKFLGIDFGWRSQPSGLCALHWQDGALHLGDLRRVEVLPEIFAWVDEQMPEGVTGGIAVDAPTLIPNETGMRLCDRLAHRYFGKYHAGCYPANLGSPFAERTLALGRGLEDRGFAHAPRLEAKQPGRFQVEVFPHPAMIHLFKLDRIIKYKKGKVAERRSELSRLRQCILTHLPVHNPSLMLPADALPVVPQRGIDLKHLEDRLDSLICAYVAAHWWAWGDARNQVLGDETTGYIIVPDPERRGLSGQPGATGDDHYSAM